MYYSTVNRGVVITGPGRWTIALIMVLGLIAIASGFNGVYLSLSVGSAILVVSGVLSERFMKSYFLESISSVTAEPRSPFTLEALARNRDSKTVVYGMENLFYTRDPKWGVFREDKGFSARSLSFVLRPGRSVKVTGQCSGLERGLYDNWRVVQRTLYPFGLVSKFKVGRVSGEVIVLPAFDDEFASQVWRSIRSQFESSDSESEFHSHRQYQAWDPIRHVDWKRSAGRRETDWVVKSRQTQASRLPVLVCAPAGWLQSATTLEAHLSRLRTAVDVVAASGREVGLEIPGVCKVAGLGNAQKALAAWPKADGPEFRGPALRFWVDGDSRWEAP